MNARRLVFLIAVTGTLWAVAAVILVFLIVWPSVWLAFVAILLWFFGFVPGLLVLKELALVATVLRKRSVNMEHELSMLARTVGRAAPVLRRIDDRGRALIHERPWKESSENSGHSGSESITLAALVSSKAQAQRAIAAFEQNNGAVNRLVLILDPDRGGHWGTWIEEPLGDRITIAAGSHLAMGIVDLNALFVNRIVLCVRVEGNNLVAINSSVSGGIPTLVSSDQVATNMGLERKDNYEK